MTTVTQPAAPMPSAGASILHSPWPIATLVLIVGTAVILLLHWPLVMAAAKVWYVSPTFNHCALIPFISAYLLWEDRAAFAALRPAPALWPLAFLLGFAVLGLLGSLVSVLEVQQFALIGLFLALVLAVMGWTVFRRALFPLLFLLFMVPTGEFLVAPLQDFTAGFIVRALELFGIPVISDGIFITLPTGVFEVAEACAGLRFLIASVAFGALFAYLMYRRWQKRLLFILLAATIPVLANGVRALGIVLLAYASNNQLAAGVDHLLYGWVFFVMVMFGMMWLGLGFRDTRESVAVRVDPVVAPRGAAASGKVVAVAVLGVMLAATAPLHAYVTGQRPEAPVVLVPPPGDSLWRPVDTAAGPEPWRPAFPGADAELLQAYSDGSANAYLYVAYFASQRLGAKVVSAENRLEDGKVWRRAASGTVPAVIEGGSFRVATQDLVSVAGTRRQVWTLYWVDGQLTSNRVWVRLLGARAGLFGRHRQAAVLALAADYAQSPREAEGLLQSLVAHLGPLGDRLRQVSP